MAGKSKINQDLTVTGSINVINGAVTIDGASLSASGTFIQNTGANMSGDLSFINSSGDQTFNISDAGVLAWGTASDVNLYRDSANTLKTDDDFVVGTLAGNNGEFISLDVNGKLQASGSTSSTFAAASHTHPSSEVTDFNEAAQDAVGGIVANSSNVTLTYNDGTPNILADLTNSGVTATTYGNSTNVGQFTVDAKGRITSASNIDLTTSFVQKTGDTINGDLTITGDLSVNGDEFIVNTVSVSAESNLIYINSNETGAGVTAGTAGIEVERGTATNYQFIFRESDDLFVVGQIGSLQAVATREDSPSNGIVGTWDSGTSRFITTGDSAVAADFTVNGTTEAAGSAGTLNDAAIFTSGGIAARKKIWAEGIIESESSVRGSFVRAQDASAWSGLTPNQVATLDTTSLNFENSTTSHTANIQVLSNNALTLFVDSSTPANSLTTIHNKVVINEPGTGGPSNAPLRIESTAPSLGFINTDEPLNEKEWLVGPFGTEFRISATDDGSSTLASAIAISRTGNTIDRVRLNGTDVRVTGGLVFSSDVSYSSGTNSTSDDTLFYFLNGISSPVTLQLPASPERGRIFYVKCIDATNTVTIDGNGNNVDGSASITLATNQGVMLRYTSGAHAWRTF